MPAIRARVTFSLLDRAGLQIDALDPANGIVAVAPKFPAAARASSEWHRGIVAATFWVRRFPEILEIKLEDAPANPQAR